jgi:hypothetical protein
MAEHEMTKEEVEQRTKKLMEGMSRHVAMAAFLRPGFRDAEAVENNGTVSLLEMPGGKFLVTNHHVWDTFVEQRDRRPGLRLALTGQGIEQPVNISGAELVDSDAGLDLAVLRFDRNDLIESIGRSFYRPKRFPLDVPVEGDDVAFLGYPGMRREPTGPLRYESVLLALKVAAVSDRKIMLRFDNPNPDIILFSPKPLTEFRWGGMSGSMVYRLDPELNQFFVAGFVHAAGEGLQASFYAGRADLIQDGGTIRR